MKENRPRMETRDIAAVLIGLEVGLGIGLLAFGTTLLAPMWMALLGAGVGLGGAQGQPAADPPRPAVAAARRPLIRSSPCQT